MIHPLAPLLSVRLAQLSVRRYIANLDATYGVHCDTCILGATHNLLVSNSGPVFRAGLNWPEIRYFKVQSLPEFNAHSRGEGREAGRQSTCSPPLFHSHKLN